ncbi:MAG TPA: hypothetical protein PKB02_12100 [Anaerohalosphaeraceae bacterium]|nr:hypothetical protein [Anaerohalosphaeraceae bacterium]
MNFENEEDEVMRNLVMYLSVVAILTAGVVSAGTYGGGSGTAESPYLIYTSEQLDLLGQTPADWGASYHFRQMAEIDLSDYTGTQFHRIGNSEQAFRGTYDGNGFSIRNFTYEDGTADYVGLFGYVLGGAASSIRNVKLIHVGVTGHNRVGALVGHGNCIIQNCSVEDGTITGNENVGGLMGYAFAPVSDCQVSAAVNGSRYVGGIASYFSSSGNAINNCRMEGTVSGGNGSMGDVGGIVGRLYSGSVSHCASTAVITANGQYAGGIVGSTFSANRIDNCIASGNVTNTMDSVGGIVGSLSFSHMSFCRANGAVQGRDFVGGIMGDVQGSSTQVSDCIAAGDVSGRRRVGGFAGRLAASSGTITLSRCGADGFDVTTEAIYGGGLVGEIQANSPAVITLSQCFAYPDVTCNAVMNDDRRYLAGLVGGALRATFSNCFAWGTVSNGYQYSGGLVGSMTGCTVANCYSIGSPSGVADTGGLIGKATNSTITNSFWDQWFSGTNLSAGGTALTTPYMQTLASYTAALWDFMGETANGSDDIWRLCAEGVSYPKLTWEHVRGGDFACPDGVAMDDMARLGRDWLASYALAMYAADADGDKTVGTGDLRVMVENWMEGI